MKYKNIFAYLRLSQDDEDKTAESNSIQNQRLLIRQFVNEKEELCGTEIMFFVDDGYSGTNFERPGFKEMMQQVSSDGNYCIIVKDFSRFGRDTVDTQNYIEKVFPFKGVRLISINDHYDSANNNQAGIDTEVKFKNLINGIYPEICSRNFKQSMRRRAELGKYNGTMPVYGYQFADGDNSALKVDETTAYVVRRIYKLRLEGESLSGIARKLNKDNIQSPAAYLQKYARTPNWKEMSVWTDASVRHILENIAYTGVVVNHKSEVIVPSKRETVRIPEENRIYVPNMHEAIISREDFEAVNAMTKKKPLKKENGIVKRKKQSYFSGILKCGYCKKSMIMSIDVKRIRYPKAFCQTARFKPECGCYAQGYRLDELEKIVLQLIKQQTTLANASMKEIDKLNNTTDAAIYKRKIGELERRHEGYKNRRLELYEAFASGDIRKEEYLSEKNILSIKENECKSTISDLKEKIAELEQQKIHYKELKNISKYDGIEALSEQILNELIDEILFYDPEHIEIKWKYKDLIISYVDEKKTM